MNDVTLKESEQKIADLLNKQAENYKCLRHRFYPSGSYCRLCEAKREAKKHFEYARKLYIKGI